MRLNTLSIFMFLIPVATCLAGNNIMDLPAIETIVAEPTIVENISLWVPAAKSGPFINRSCRLNANLAVSTVLPASVEHEKTKYCPQQIARILAELTSFYHCMSLPLTIFNGWQWEYTYSLCQFESVSYDLARRGGCWENCWEAVLDLSYGEARLQKLYVESLEKFDVRNNLPIVSTIEIKTFSSMRARNGYPKNRQL